MSFKSLGNYLSIPPVFMLKDQEYDLFTINDGEKIHMKLHLYSSVHLIYSKAFHKLYAH